MMNRSIGLLAILTLAGCAAKLSTVPGVIAHYPAGAVTFDVDALSTRFSFPGGKWKALILSFDDGNVQDRKLVGIFNRYGIRGTFNLNSGKFGKVETWDRTYSYISSDEVATLYAGHDIAVHTVSHPYLTDLSPTAIKFEIGQDKRNLEALVGRPVRGMAYPFNSYNDIVVSLLPGLGIEFARSSWGNGSFKIPSKPLNWKMTCHYSQAMNYVDKFLALPSGEMAILSVGGHSWELDNDDPSKNWDMMEAFCKLMGGRADMWYPTMIEVVDYLKAVSSVKFTADGKTVTNPSSMSVWVNTPGGPVEVKAGETVKLAE